jgi:ribosomal protein S18 acetylase RimI-like enzyme
MCEDYKLPLNDPAALWEHEWFAQCLHGTFEDNYEKKVHTSHTFVALASDGSVVGAILIYHTKDNDAAYVFWAYVDQNHRSSGIGKKLFDHAVRYAVANWGITRVQLHVLQTNPRGLAFWQRQGFEFNKLTFLKTPISNKNIPCISKRSFAMSLRLKGDRLNL